MNLRRLTAMAVLAAVVSIAVVSEGQAGGGTPITSCGQSVTTNAFLTGDLYCAGSTGIFVNAPGITVDLKGFTLRGDGSAGDYGILGFDGGVTIKNGVVRNFDWGVTAYYGSDKVTVSDLVASANVHDGIEVFGASAKIESSSAAGNGGYGMLVVGGGAQIKSSTSSRNGSGMRVNGASEKIHSFVASGNKGDALYVNGDYAQLQSVSAIGNAGRGIYVGGHLATVQSSTVSGNDFGIELSGDADRVNGNRAEGNGYAGGVSDLIGTGIYVTGYTTAPTGKNVARGNDDPAECVPAALC